MVAHFSRARWLCWLAVLSACSPVKPPSGKSPLLPTEMSPTCAVLEVFFIRCSADDPTANDLLWEELDEQILANDLRAQLARNGFRVGLAGGRIPLALSKLLALKDAPPPDSGTEADLQAQSRVTRRRLQVRPNQRHEIIASEVYDELPVLLRESGQLCGETFPQAQAMFSVTTMNLRDGRVQIELLPELHHGANRQRWVAGQGVYRLEAGREKKAFEAMRVPLALAPGQMLVMSGLASRPGSLGHHFFKEKRAGSVEQKLLVVRLAQTQHDDLVLQEDSGPQGSPNQ